MIELLITIAIVAILAALAMPSYRQTIQSNRTTTEANEFLTAINVARGEAMTRSRPVTLCPSEDGTNCSDSTDWAANRWIVFTDYGTRGQVDATSDTVLRAWDAISPQDSFAASSDAAAIKWISFDRSGSAITDNGSVNAGTEDETPRATFKLRPRSCASNSGQVQRIVTIELRGRASIVNEHCSS